MRSLEAGFQVEIIGTRPSDITFRFPFAGHHGPPMRGYYRVDEPLLKAMFETAAEVLGGRRPLLIGPRSNRGVVLTVSYEARPFGGQCDADGQSRHLGSDNGRLSEVILVSGAY
jgi:hypothetical protein